jgi:hypothetical protein
MACAPDPGTSRDVARKGLPGVSITRDSARDAPVLTFRVQPTQVASLLRYLITCFVLAHIVVKTVALVSGHDYIFGLVPMFDLDAERNLPTLFSALLFVLSGVLSAVLWVAGRARHTPGIMWLVLAGVFVFLGVDEFVGLHERLDRSLQSRFHTSGLLTFAWLVPYGVFASVLGLALIPHLKRIRPAVRNYLVAAGVIYLVGALGLEMVSGAYYQGQHTKQTFLWVVLTTLEELFEMIGLSLLVYALLLQLVTVQGTVAVLLTATSERQVKN